MSQNGSVSVRDGGKIYKVLFSSEQGYVKNFQFLEVSDGSDSLPTRESISAIIGRQWSGKELTLSLEGVKKIDWSAFLPKAIRSRGGIYVVSGEDIVVGAYFLGCYCDSSNTDMSAIRQGFLSSKDAPLVFGVRHHSGVIRPDFAAAN